MEQFEKVCKGLECCEKDVQLCYGETVCEYYSLSPRCWTTLAHDALALIRQQQKRIKELEAWQTPRVMTLEEVCGWTKGEPLFIEEETPGGNFSGYNVFHFSDYQYVCFTPFRGDGCYFIKEDYGLTWRCWTQRPTDEQREAVKWDA